MRTEVDSMEELYSRAENLIRTRALTVAGTDLGGRGSRETLKAMKTEVESSPGQETLKAYQDNEKQQRQFLDSAIEAARQSGREAATSMAQEVIINYLTSQNTGHNPSFAPHVPEQVGARLQQAYEQATVKVENARAQTTGAPSAGNPQTSQAASNPQPRYLGAP